MRLRNVHIVLALWLGLAAIQALRFEGWWCFGLFGALAAHSALAAVLRLGCMVPCTILGAVSGFLLDPKVKGGDPESQMWESVWYLGCGTAVGLIVGLAIDLAAWLVSRLPPLDGTDE